jgi:hypothetical protein
MCGDLTDEVTGNPKYALNRPGFRKPFRASRNTAFHTLLATADGCTRQAHVADIARGQRGIGKPPRAARHRRYRRRESCQIRSGKRLRPDVRSVAERVSFFRPAGMARHIGDSRHVHPLRVPSDGCPALATFEGRPSQQQHAKARPPPLPHMARRS